MVVGVITCICMECSCVDQVTTALLVRMQGLCFMYTLYVHVIVYVMYCTCVGTSYTLISHLPPPSPPLSVRWKVLLSFSCRNRLLLTGTPIQNTMQEVGSPDMRTHLY